ncbi:MAG: hypothetical protein ACOYM2_00875 [Rectinemataceae bacterium]
MSDEVQEFWDAFESETGEKVETRGMGSLREGNEGRANERWGLLILTDRAFHFRSVPSANWISGLLSRSASTKPQKTLEIRIAREDILEVMLPTRNLWDRILAPPFEDVSIRSRDATSSSGEAGTPAEGTTRRFGFERKGDVLKALLGAFGKKDAP